ncbi:hypothetical protein [Couchioplanes caeruleus]|uniref:Uncharacterized protein n=2 Tax=Couchioplanes caeruleus TaxID=56438 RepID=A0A1K0GHF4_9ACTN|nr:hypothetical protein [Couchioplanes caeruleus]OJF10340.1 hypothetical protein BG844_32360 [Couchioplanes caeruleus subsp. caeruleus]ROP32276.1 hypothetical protein EDD30_5213 [Couchioplanes caeruleus]
MEAYLDPAYEWTSLLVGPEAVVPWWAWVALLVMIFWSLLAPGLAAARKREEERQRIFRMQEAGYRRLHGLDR